MSNLLTEGLLYLDIERRGALLLAIASRGNLRRSFYVFSNPCRRRKCHPGAFDFGKLIWALPSFWCKMRRGFRIGASPLLISVSTSDPAQAD